MRCGVSKAGSGWLPVHRLQSRRRVTQVSLPHADGHADVQASIRALNPWFHNFRFGTVQTAPDHFLGDYPRVKWERFASALPADLHGATVLDIGCNAGFYSIEMKKRGADRVLGIDVDHRYLQQAHLAALLSQVNIELRQMSVYELSGLRERFDVVLFMGVLYHLRHPLLALDLIREYVARDLVVVQSMLRGSRHLMTPETDYDFHDEQAFADADYPAMFFVERRYAGDPTNWWVPNASALAAMLRSSGLPPIARPEEEVFICRTAELAVEPAHVNVGSCPPRRAPL
jgi:tRNA (mo5U34)-methyltransferase